MIENVFFVIKMVFFVIGVMQLSRLNIGFSFFVPFFMTGVELATRSKTPWSFLLSGEASQHEMMVAFIGGLGFMAICLLVASVIPREQVDPKKRGETK